MATFTQAEFALAAQQVEQFHRDGFLGPLEACSPDEMAPLREHMERVLKTKPFGSDGSGTYHFGHNRHLEDRRFYDFCTRPQIVERLASIVGPDILLWRTNFFTKEPGGKEIPWHQDYNYWPIEPAIVASVWVAFDEVTTENSCVQMIPGSHRKILRHIPAGDEMQFDEMANTQSVDLSTKVDMVMKPGEFFLFNERTLHHSNANTSDKRRMGMAIRCIVPIVRVMQYDADWHVLNVIAGKDRMGFNRLGDPSTGNAV